MLATFKGETTVHIYLNYLVPLHIDLVLVPHVYSQVIIIHGLLFPCVIISLFFPPLHCWQGTVSKHFNVGLHLLFTKHVTSNI